MEKQQNSMATPALLRRFWPYTVSYTHLQHKAARAVCIFHIAPRKACLAEQGGLLVARRARDG